MTIIEIGISNLVSHQSCIAPSTFVYSPVPRKLAYFWTDVFGCPDESSQDKLIILGVYINYSVRLARVNSFAECAVTPTSFAFDMTDCRLCVNYGPNYNPLFDTVQYLRSLGFTDSRVVYIDDIEYLPLLKDAPKISARQDLINYDKMAMGSAEAALDNTSGYLNFIKDLSLFSNDVAMYYLKDAEEQERSRDELQSLSYNLVDDIRLSLKDGRLTMQDVRAAMNVSLPKNEFSKTEFPNIEDDLVGNPIPLILGQVEMVPAIFTGEIDVDNYAVFKLAESFTSIPASALVRKEETWASIDVVSFNAANGTIRLRAANVLDADGKAKEVKIGPVTGHVIVNAPDAIAVLDNIANNVNLTESFYDLAEWNAEKASVSAIGMYIEEKTELFELIRQIQEGASVRFRYEYNTSGLRTIRVDDDARASIMHVNKEDILENGVLAFYTDRQTVAAFIEIKYNKNYVDETYPSIKDASKAGEILANLRQQPTITFETYITNSVTAAERAANEASKLGKVRKFADLTLCGEQYLFLRICDTLDVELYTDQDEWLGLWKCKVMAIAPDGNKLQNKVTLCLLEKIAVFGDNQHIMVYEDGDIMTVNADKDEIRMAE